MLILIIGAVAWFTRPDAAEREVRPQRVETPAETGTVETDTTETAALVTEVAQADIVAPLDRAAERVTKKPFGVLIDRATSPVQPERFSGYHTGTDFEAFPEEAALAVPVSAICGGEVLAKRTASGYGGVFVTSCVIETEPVTVVYGHLALSSIGPEVGERIEAGATIGLLGEGGTSDTDLERKHLHLGIHRGPAIDIRGYVARESDLSSWLDPCLFLCTK